MKIENLAKGYEKNICIAVINILNDLKKKQ